MQSGRVGDDFHTAVCQPRHQSIQITPGVANLAIPVAAQVGSDDAVAGLQVVDESAQMAAGGAGETMNEEQRPFPTLVKISQTRLIRQSELLLHHHNAMIAEIGKGGRNDSGCVTG